MTLDLPSPPGKKKTGFDCDWIICPVCGRQVVMFRALPLDTAQEMLRAECEVQEHHEEES